MAQIKSIYGNEVIDDALRCSMANEYSASSTYAVGDMVLKDGQLYECNTAISTAEAWTAAHWTAVTVGGELSTVKDGLTAVESDVTDLKEDYDDIDDRVTALEQGGTGGGLTEDIKQALLQIVEKVAYIDDDGQDYYDDLYDALYPPVDLVSISAVYTQSGTVYDTDTLDSLKADLVVTALYSDQTTQTVTTYTLSGTLEEGTSVITVSYGGKTTTFNVTVTELIVLTGYTEVGSPTISNNILTVGDGKFIMCNQAFAPGNDPWKVVCKYQRTENFGAYTDIIGTVDSSGISQRGFLLEYSNSSGTAGAMYCSSNGAAWDITSGQTANSIPNALNTWVWASVEFTGSAYIFKTSTDGETWTTQKEISSSTSIYDVTGYTVGFGVKRSGYIKGNIDLTACEIYKNGNLWWKAVA